jgi:carbonic anhydrase
MKYGVFLLLLIILLAPASLLSGVDNSRKILQSGEHAVTKELQQSLSPREIIELLKEGNRRFMSGKTIGHNYQQQARESASAQFPPAVVLSCIDSRVVPEIVFDTGLGDIFDVRVAGNIVNRDIAGSMEYACNVTGSKVVLVMGHTSCGAVKGTLDGVKLFNLTGLLSKLKPAVDAMAKVAEERTSKNKKLVDAAALENVKLTVEKIRSISPVLRQMEQENKILITGCLYDIKSRAVMFLD